MSSTTPTQTTAEGNSMMPEPRMTLASPLMIQSSVLPKNTTFE